MRQPDIEIYLKDADQQAVTVWLGEAIGPVSGATWRTKEAVLGADGRWYGVWRLDARTPAAAYAAPEHITLDTCKVDDR